MKIKNKKTGEIVEATDFNIISEYNSLAELNEDWEDYEEQKKYWYLTDAGCLCQTSIHNDKTAIRKRIGNYFDTKEEAEKAVEKLRAWKRLKDKGFKFIGVRGIGKVIDFDIPEPYNHVGFDEYVASKDEIEFYDDLLLLFGGE